METKPLVPPIEGEQPKPHTVGIVRQRLGDALIIAVSRSKLDPLSREDRRAGRILWQQEYLDQVISGEIQRLQHGELQGASSADLENRALNMDAATVAKGLEDWIIERSQDPKSLQDPRFKDYMDYARDLQSKLDQEASSAV